MTWIAPQVTRDQAPLEADERTMLEGWLTYHRQTLLHKCAGLTAEQLKRRSVEPSSLSLLGLVRHMAEVERFWFRQSLAGADIPAIYYSEDNPDGDFDDVADAVVEADFEVFRTEATLADEATRGRSLDDTFRGRHGRDVSLRWIYVHMIEEYARHNGHADLLRERIDGATGD
jgi:uncharacterized damage-inducible protein DinB